MRPQITRIIRDLQDKDEDIATYAAMNVLRLKEIREDEISALIPTLRQSTTHPNIAVRFFAKKALNEVKLQIPKFKKLAHTFDLLREETRASSWQDLLDEIRRADTEKKLMILDLLRDVDDPSVLPALSEYAQAERDEFVLAEVVRILGMIGKEEIIPVLQGFLQHRDSRIRSNAAEALEEIGGKQVVKSLVPLLEDDDNRVKATVAKIVSRHGETNVLHTVAGMLRSVEIWMRESATYALGFIPYEEAVDLLLEAMLDVNQEVQKKAIAGLANLKPKKAVEFLHRIIASGDPALMPPAQIALDRIMRGGIEYQYFDPKSDLARNPGYLKPIAPANKPRKKEEAAPPVEAAPAPEAQPKKRFFGLFDRSRKQDAAEIVELERARNEMCIELGRKCVSLFRRGDLDRSYIREADNEIKKLEYLIEQKESHKKEIKEESLRTTFINFLKDSVYRFSTEKRVEQRISSLQQRLLDTYADIGRKLMETFDPGDVDMMALEAMPGKIQKMTRQIDDVRRRLNGGEVAAPPTEDAPPGPDAPAPAAAPGAEVNPLETDLNAPVKARSGAVPVPPKPSGSTAAPRKPSGAVKRPGHRPGGRA
jgi:HEAT repeat protein